MKTIIKKREICKKCNGKGILPMDFYMGFYGEHMCNICGGTGVFITKEVIEDEEMVIYSNLLKKWQSYKRVCCSVKGDNHPSFEGFMDYMCNLYNIQEESNDK
jgi:hypothetical protein